MRSLSCLFVVMWVSSPHHNLTFFNCRCIFLCSYFTVFFGVLIHAFNDLPSIKNVMSLDYQLSQTNILTVPFVFLQIFSCSQNIQFSHELSLELGTIGYLISRVIGIRKSQTYAMNSASSEPCSLEKSYTWLILQSHK